MQLVSINANLQERLHQLVGAHYRIGEIESIEGLADGYCNRNFLIRIRRAGKLHAYILRRYHPDRTAEQIRFEHSFIHHVRQNNFSLAAGVINCRDGRTWLRETNPENHLPYYWAIFDFLPGKDKYTWIQNDLSKPELISAAEVLALLHGAAIGFRPPSAAAANRPLVTDFLHELYLELVGKTEAIRSSGIQALIKSQRSQIVNVIKHSLTVEKPLEALPEIAIHFDYHPGNLKFGHNRVIGVFDFDWSRMGYRAFDLSLALIYFTGSWENKGIGELDLDRFELFLQTYNKALGTKSQLPPLGAIEAELLPRLLAVSNLFILKWALDECIVDPPKRRVFIDYINHNLKLLNWIDKSTRQINERITPICDSQMR